MCFNFFTDLATIIYIYIYLFIYIYIAAFYLATVTLQRLDFIGVCSVLTYYSRMYEYTSYVPFNHNVWCIGLYLFHTNE